MCVCVRDGTVQVKNLKHSVPKSQIPSETSQSWILRGLTYNQLFMLLLLYQNALPSNNNRLLS